MKEIWREHPTFTDYTVSNLGRLKKIKTGRILKVHFAHRKIPQVTVFKDGIRLLRSLHILVYEAFNGVSPDRPRIGYKDGDVTNVELSNLVIVERKNRKVIRHYAGKIVANPARILPLYEVEGLNLIQLLGRFYLQKSPKGFPYFIFEVDSPIPEVFVNGFKISSYNQVTKYCRSADFVIIDSIYDSLWSDNVVCFIVQERHYDKKGRLNKLYRVIFRDLTGLLREEQ